jgi:hypothetical protein
MEGATGTITIVNVVSLEHPSGLLAIRVIKALGSGSLENVIPLGGVATSKVKDDEFEPSGQRYDE